MTTDLLALAEPMPIRVQLSRKKGWRMPDNTVKVDRATKWGNPARVELIGMIGTDCEDEAGNEILEGPWACLISRPNTAPAGWWFPTKEDATAKAVEYFRYLLTQAPARHGWANRLPELRGKNLACWCPLDQPCHADVLLEIANPSLHPSEKEEG